jgi:hypothetical protein
MHVAKNNVARVKKSVNASANKKMKSVVQTPPIKSALAMKNVVVKPIKNKRSANVTNKSVVNVMKIALVAMRMNNVNVIKSANSASAMLKINVAAKIKSAPAMPNANANVAMKTISAVAMIKNAHAKTSANVSAVMKMINAVAMKIAGAVTKKIVAVAKMKTVVAAISGQRSRLTRQSRRTQPSHRTHRSRHGRHTQTSRTLHRNRLTAHHRRSRKETSRSIQKFLAEKSLTRRSLQSSSCSSRSITRSS